MGEFYREISKIHEVFTIIFFIPFLACFFMFNAILLVIVS